MDTTQLPHLGLRAAKKLNPKLQCWRWNDGFMANFTYEPGCWIPVGTPSGCLTASTQSQAARRRNRHGHPVHSS